MAQTVIFDNWLNCALQGDEAVYLVSIGQQCNDWYLAVLSQYEVLIDVIGSALGSVRFLTDSLTDFESQKYEWCSRDAISWWFI